jgi:hypothetical protein
MEEPKYADEIRKMQQEPLLPIEKKLILWSVVIGVSLIGGLAWVSHVLFG